MIEVQVMREEGGRTREGKENKRNVIGRLHLALNSGQAGWFPRCDSV